MTDGKRQGDSDRALARLLAEALRPPAGATADSACPDAGLLAAYADHNLDAAETALWEEHFAGCARCQKILAVLTVSGEEPLSEAEVERFGRLAAAAGRGVTRAEPRAAEANKVAPFALPWTSWRWLAPAVGVAAAAALWIALRPAPPHGTPAVTAQKAQNANVQPVPPPGESLEAKANVPAPPVAASREAQPGLPEPQQQKSLALAQSLKKESQQAPSAAQAPQSAVSADGAAAAAPQPVAGLRAAGAAAAGAPTAAGNSPQVAATEESPAAVPSASPPVSAPAAPAPEVAARAAAQAAAPAPANGADAKQAEIRPAQAFAARSAIAGLVSRAPVMIA